MKKYSHLLSPVRIGHVILKNRMISTNSMPHYLMGPEEYPPDSVIAHFVDLAKNGAALLTFPEYLSQKDMPFRSDVPYLNIQPYDNQNYFAQLADAVHFCGSKLSISLVPMLPEGYCVEERPAMNPMEREQNPSTAGAPPFSGMGPLKEAPTEMIDQTIEDVAKRALIYKQCGFDGVTFHACYRGSTAGQLWSPLCNHRSDKYGCDSVENRARFIIELGRRCKALCGKDFIVEVQLTAVEKNSYGVKDTIEFCRLAEGAVDILQVRADNGDDAHPTGYNSVPGHHLMLDIAETIKQSGTKLLIAPVGGFQNLDENEAYIAGGKCDMIGMARAFICDPEYGRKAYEGRGEDVVPCLRCNRCHVAQNRDENWTAACSVNPKLGISHRLAKLSGPSEAPDFGQKKKVAVVGGGPAGMKAAILAAEQGHAVTLFEKSDKLGGQLVHADLVSFKWPLRDFKDYLILQVYKAGVDVRLGTEATPEMLKAEGFDAIIAALGATPALPPVPVDEGARVWVPTAVYGQEDKLGQRVVVVGGSSTGAETGIHLAEKGHDVTVLTRSRMLAEDSNVVHFYDTMVKAWQALPNFRWIPKATTTRVKQDGVVYTDSDGNEQFVPADSVILCGGVTPHQEEALAFYGASDWCTVIGDCEKPGNVQKCMRQALAAVIAL